MSREGTTQGDNLEMSFLAFGITPVLRSLKIKCPDTKQVSLADYVGYTKKLKILRSGRMSQFHKYKRLLKSEPLTEFIEGMFNATGIKITMEEKRHLGVSRGSGTFCEKCAIIHGELQKDTYFV